MTLSHYTRKDSPWVWVQWSLGPGHPKRYEKLPVRKDDPEVKHKVAVEMNTLEAMLLKSNTSANPRDVQVSAWGWVRPWLEVRYATRLSSQDVYLAQWKSILNFLMEKDVASPRFVTRQHVFSYVEWRQSKVKEKSGRTVKVNTALGELKLFAMVLDEAIARNMAVTNPVRRHRIPREQTDVKPELDEAFIHQVYAKLQEPERPQWMFRSFHVALQTGLRFSDTAIHRSQVRWASEDLVIERPKGGRKKEFAIPIYPGVRDMIADWYHNTREPYLWDLPEAERKITSLRWHWFFKDEMHRPDVCFHCTRVTFIMSGLRAGIPENVMLKMVNHASKLVNRIYQRWTSDDVRRYSAAISIPGISAAK